MVRRPAKNVMQSGTFRNNMWYVEFEPSSSQYIEPLMGWTGTEETSQQVRLCFGSKDEAIAYVEAKKIPYVVLKDHTSKRIQKSYAENFLRNRSL
nr:ETC complex I subunit [Anaplasma platys]